MDLQLCKDKLHSAETAKQVEELTEVEFNLLKIEYPLGLTIEQASNYLDVPEEILSFLIENNYLTLHDNNTIFVSQVNSLSSYIALCKVYDIKWQDAIANFVEDQDTINQLGGYDKLAKSIQQAM